MTEDLIYRALWFGKWACVGIGAIVAMMFIAFPVGIALVFGWEAFVTALTDAARGGAQ